MAITILPPAPANNTASRTTQDDDQGLDIESDSDVDMEESSRLPTRAKISRHLVTPGELVTSDPQWMR